MPYYKPLVNWLKIGAFMVVVMVAIGGVTRLTDSGLSMVDWKLFHGTIPPLDDLEWQETFDDYKNYPEYKLINFNMTLDEFKSIFFWEWSHRVWGRLIGLVFIIPFVFFLIKKKISKPLTYRLIGLLMLGALQGYLGWYMVSSGLKYKPDVSHYRLAIHLVTAFATFAYILWLIFNITSIPGSYSKGSDRFINKSLYLLVPLIVIQIVYGAFVAGLNAGMVFPTWPKMGGYWMPPQITNDWNSNGVISLFDEPVSVQFIHRIVAYLILVLVTVLWVKARKLEIADKVRKAVNILMLAVLVQVVLGITTLLMHVPLYMGELHQLGALFLLSSAIYLIYHSQDRLSSFGKRV